MRLAVVVTFFAWAYVLCGSLPYAYGDVINAPDAYVLEHTEIQAGLAASAYTFEGEDGISESDVKLTGYIDIGILSYGQLGMSYLADGGMVLNAKVAVIKEGLAVPAFSLGVQNGFGPERVDCFSGPPGTPDSLGNIIGVWDEEGFYNYDHAQNWSVYGVASKDMRYLTGLPVTLSLGIGIGRFVGVIGEGGAMGIGSAVANGLFGSLAWKATDNLALAMEVDGRDLNLGMDYRVNRYVNLHLAWGEAEMTLLPPEDQNRRDIMQNSKVTVAISSRFGPLFGARRLELEREQQRIERARQRLDELESRRRAAESELQRLRDLLDERR